MQKKITDSTAGNALGNPGQSKLFRVSSGTYTGRRVALIQTSSSEIKLAWSDSPGTQWSSLETIASDARDGNFDAVMTSAGDIQLVYSLQTTNYLVTKRLTLGAGTWSVGSTVTIYNGAQCYDPSLVVDSAGDFWVTYSRFVSPNRTIYAKSSTDDGVTWGSGASDAGDAISAASMFGWSKMVADGSYVRVVYHNQDTAMSMRSRAISGGSWSTSENIATGSGFDVGFDVAESGDGRIGVAFNRGQLYYREFDGSNWGALTIIVSKSVVCPQLIWENQVPAVVYVDTIGTQIRVARFVDRRTGSFSTPDEIDSRSAPLSKVFLYDASADSYEDLTTAASDTTAADVYHSSSGRLLLDSGDVLYLGLDARFRAASLNLSTVGAGGTIQVSYWDGAEWSAFTPASGAVDMSAANTDLLLWTDYTSMPDDWQKRQVNSSLQYWIKIEVVSSFSTGPIGTQITATTELERIIFRR